MIWALLLACADPAPVTPPPADAPADPAQFEPRRKELYAKLKDLRADLEEAGRYDCCVKNPCAYCAMRGGGCKCGEGLRRGEPVCDECAYLWLKGHGAEPVDPDSVRGFTEAERQVQGKACACPDHDATGATPRPRPPRTGPDAPGTVPAPAPTGSASPAPGSPASP